MAKWSGGRKAEADRPVVESVRNVVQHDAGASRSSHSFEQSETTEDSPVARFGSGVPADSRRVRDNRPGGVRRPPETQGRLKLAVGLGDKIALSFKYDPVLISVVKQLPGRRWDVGGKRWICEPSVQLRELLHEHMFVVDELAEKMLNDAPVVEMVNEVRQQGPVLIMKAGYHPDLVARVREIPTRKWDKSQKTWSFSVAVIAQVEELAQDFCLAWKVSADYVDDSQDLEVSGNWFSVRYSADRDIQEMIGELFGTRLDPVTMRWMVPKVYAPELALAQRKYSWTHCSESQKAFMDVAREVELLELSKADTGRIVVPGVQIELMPFQQAGVVYVLKALGASEVMESKWMVGPQPPQDSLD